MKYYHYSNPTFIDECKTSTIHQRHITRHEINNDIIIDYFLKKEFINVSQKIDTKIAKLNKHSSDCKCDDCKLLMKEIRIILDKKN